LIPLEAIEMRIQRVTGALGGILGAAPLALAGCSAPPSETQEAPITHRIYPLSVQPRRVHDISMFSEVNAASAPAGAHMNYYGGRVVSNMQDITDSSRRIADIIGVIDGIAFQTNILALNAAVEAARAGENGRGFAVVAGEVRSLAQRSADAAKEIKALIGQSVDKVEAGAKLVGDAGKTMNDIVVQVRRVSELIAEISHSSAQQSAGIGQVGDAVNQLDQVTQQNAALVEESAAAAESLSQQAARLVEAVGVFRLGAD